MAKYCGNCGHEILENAYVCVKCGVVVNNNENYVNHNSKMVDKGGFGWGVLGYFFPVVGLILYLVWKDSKPKSAKSAGKGALISVIVGVVFSVLIMVIFGAIFNGMASNI